MQEFVIICKLYSVIHKSYLIKKRKKESYKCRFSWKVKLHYADIKIYIINCYLRIRITVDPVCLDIHVI